MAKSTRWKHVKLGEIAEFRNGVNYNKESFGSGVKVVGVKDFQDYSKPKYDTLEQINPEGVVTSKSILHDGDIIFVRSNGNRELIGRSLFIDRPTEEVTHSAFTIRVRFNSPEIYPKFYSYYFRTSAIRKGLSAYGGGTNISNLNQDILSGLDIPIPDLPTQHKIAGILSTYDDLIENNLRRIKILEEMAQSLYREWFVNFRFPGHESVKFVDSALGQIPTGWKVKAIGDFGKIVTGKTPSKANEDFFGEDIPFLKTPDMHGQIFILRTNEYLATAGAQSQANKTLPVGSICVSCIGTIGVVSITTEPCQTNQQINSVVLEDQASREYLFFWLREAKQMLENLGSNGATMGNVNKSKFEGMKLVCPPRDLLARFHSVAEPMFEQIERLFRKIQNLRQTRDLLLPKLLSNQ